MQVTITAPVAALNPAWIGFAGVLVGGLVTGIVQFFLSRGTFRPEKAWALYEQRRAHLEQVYQTLEEFRATYGSEYTDVFHVARGGELPTTTKVQREVPWSRLGMLVHLYVPDLVPHLAALSKATEAVADALLAVMAKGSPTAVRAIMEQYNRAMGGVNSAVDAAQKHIVAEAARLATETRVRTDKWLVQKSNAPRTKMQRFAARLRRWPWTSDQPAFSLGLVFGDSTSTDRSSAARCT